MAFIHPGKTGNAAARSAGRGLTCGHPFPTQYRVRELPERRGHHRRAFPPKALIARMSDCGSNKYAGMLGGAFSNQSKRLA